MDILDKIDGLLCTDQQKRDMYSLLEVAVFMDTNPTMLNEGFGDIMGKLEGLAKSMGIHVSASGRGGMIGILARSGKVMSEFIWHSIKAATGNKESQDKVKELANKEISKADILDFLLRLDGLTLHTFTGPIHMIDNLTGWHIWAAIHDKVEDVTSRAAKALEDLVNAVKEIEDTAKQKAKSLLQGIARVLNLEQEHKYINSTL